MENNARKKSVEVLSEIYRNAHLALQSISNILPAVENEEIKKESVELEKNASLEMKQERKLPWSKKLKILSSLLWGGAFLLCYEHIWHGEVVPFFPFLTAMNDPGDTAEMLHEMGTVGVTMAVIVTVVWAIMMFVADRIMTRPDPEPVQTAA